MLESLLIVLHSFKDDVVIVLSTPIHVVLCQEIVYSELLPQWSIVI